MPGGRAPGAEALGDRLIYVTHVFACEAPGCGTIDVDRQYQTALEMVPRRPDVPFGWRRLDHRLICDRHVIDILDRRDV